MYNKLFSKILDSSIWLASDATRIVFLTCIASMDQDGFCEFASVPNLAHRARVALEACDQAVRELEAPDPYSADPENEGRRLERVPGGWLVLNAAKYRELVKRSDQREATARRVRKHRETRRNAPPVTGNRSEIETETVSNTGSRVAADPVLEAPQSEAAPAAATAAAAALEGARNGRRPDGSGAPAGVAIVAPEAAPAPAGVVVSLSAGLIRSPLDYEKAMRRCSYVGARLEVPHKLHRDLSRDSGAAAAGLLAWYALLDQELEESGEAIAPDVFRWVTARWRTWIAAALEEAEAAKFLNGAAGGG